jgi:hypothetical protein
MANSFPDFSMSMRLNSILPTRNRYFVPIYFCARSVSPNPSCSSSMVKRRILRSSRTSRVGMVCSSNKPQGRESQVQWKLVRIWRLQDCMPIRAWSLIDRVHARCAESAKVQLLACEVDGTLRFRASLTVSYFFATRKNFRLATCSINLCYSEDKYFVKLWSAASLE